MRRHEDASGSPHKLHGFVWLGTLIPAGLRSKIVPREFWDLDADEKGDPVAIVCCPCGHTPRLGLAEAAQPCRCQRGFFFDGTDVWALNSPRAGDIAPWEQMAEDFKPDEPEGGVDYEGVGLEPTGSPPPG